LSGCADAMFTMLSTTFCGLMSRTRESKYAGIFSKINNQNCYKIEALDLK
jgi:hypothetical protein